MPRRYIFVVGGVCSGLGKGVAGSAIGRLLKSRGFEITMQKFDPYFNVDPGTINPCQHGEVFVTDDGAETDLDLGHYERFIDENLSQRCSVSAGQVYQKVLEKERQGRYEGGTVQVIPHVIDAIKNFFIRDESSPRVESVTIIEVGGTVGDIESQPFLEAIRQFQREVGHRQAIIIHVTLIPYLKVSGELKTKPTQSSVHELQRAGLAPDIIICRTEIPLEDSVRNKIALFCNVAPDRVIENIDLEFLYELPLALEKQGIARAVCDCWEMGCPPIDLREWERVVAVLKSPTFSVTVAIVGKYLSLHDSYLSVMEALKHGGIAHSAGVKIKWVDSENVASENVCELLSGVNGMIVPGGFGDRGCNGMMMAISYARTRKLPYLGICLGMQLAVIEFARNVVGLEDANSTEFDPKTGNPVIDVLCDKSGVLEIGRTLRRGAYECVLMPGTKAAQIYGEEQISERHRWEVNNKYRGVLMEHGMVLSGLSPDRNIVEMVEVEEHPYFMGTQGHPEFKSRPNRPHPLFAGLIGAALAG